MRTYILNAIGADISPATIIICGDCGYLYFCGHQLSQKLKNGCCGGGGDEVKHVKAAGYERERLRPRLPHGHRGYALQKLRHAH